MSSEYPLLLCTFELRDQRFSLSDKTKFDIGRRADADLVLTSSFISRQQCKISREGSSWIVVNASNQKTTFVNSRRLEEPHYLQSGDKISFMHYVGDIVFITDPAAKDVDVDAIKQEYENKLQVLRNSANKDSFQIADLRGNIQEQRKQLEEYIQKEKSATEKLEELTSRLHDLECHKAELALCCTEQRSEIQDLIAELEKLHEEQIDYHGSGGVTIIKPEHLSDMVESKLVKQELDEKEAKINELNGLLEERDSRFQSFLNTFESEMSCCVCSDIIYEAIILNCQHTFCKVCLNEWKKTRKECPECRTKIKSEVRNLKIDAFIERVTPYLGPSYVARREEIIKERAKPRASSTPVRSRGNRGNRRSSPYVALNTVSLDHILDEAYLILSDAALQFPNPMQIAPDVPQPVPPVRRRASNRGQRGRGANREI